MCCRDGIVVMPRFGWESLPPTTCRSTSPVSCASSALFSFNAILPLCFLSRCMGPLSSSSSFERCVCFKSACMLNNFPPVFPAQGRFCRRPLPLPLSSPNLARIPEVRASHAVSGQVGACNSSKALSAIAAVSALQTIKAPSLEPLNPPPSPFFLSLKPPTAFSPSSGAGLEREASGEGAAEGGLLPPSRGFTSNRMKERSQ